MKVIYHEESFNSSKNSNHSDGKTNILWSEACLKTSTYSDKSIKQLNFTK